MARLYAKLPADLECRDVPGFPGYKVGSDGSVWSCRGKGWPKVQRWHRLRPRRNTARRPPGKDKRYLTVRIFADRPDTKGKNYLIHRLVLEAFVGPCPPGMEGCHLDDDPENNRLDNLRWDTPEANREDATRRRRWRYGGRNPHAKLREEDVQAIRRLRREGTMGVELAQRFGVSKTVIYRVAAGTDWAHVPEGDCASREGA
jgi:hypothetical protein